MIDASYLTIEFGDGREVTVPLSMAQSAIVAKILGFKIEASNLTCYSDETLEKLINFNGNPLRLEEVNHED